MWLSQFKKSRRNLSLRTTISQVQPLLLESLPILSGWPFRSSTLPDTSKPFWILAAKSRQCQRKCSNEVGIHYNPEIHIPVQIANGGINPTRGSASNVPFTFGDITLHLQVHIVETTVYDVLLGRPFDVLTRSSIQNAEDESQTFTITDPNAEQRVAIPTHPRGRKFDPKCRIRNPMLDIPGFAPGSESAPSREKQERKLFD